MMRHVRLLNAMGVTAALSLYTSTLSGDTQVTSAGAPGVVAPQPGRRVVLGFIRGRVLSEDTRAALRNVELRISGGSLPEPRFVVTNAQGRYEVGDLPPGRYVVTASKAGFVTKSYGQRKRGEAPTPIELRESQSVNDLDIVLERWAVIVARAVNEFGDPLSGLSVQVFESNFVNGERKFRIAGSGAVNSSDDRGEVRLFGLAAGEYFLSIRPGPYSSSRGVQRAEIFYPGTAALNEAQPIVIGAGEEVPVTIPYFAVRLASITGTLFTSAGQTRSATQITLRQNRAGGSRPLPITLAVDGSFLASSVPPGDYVIQVRSQTEQGTEYAAVPLQVDRQDVSGLAVTTSRGATIRGRLTFDNTAAEANKVDVVPTFTDGRGMSLSAGRARVNDNLTFQIDDLMGIGVLRVRDSSGRWFLRNVFAEGRDIADEPLAFSTLAGRVVDIVLTQKVTELSGTASDGKSEIHDYVVVLFPQDTDKWTPYTRSIVASRSDQQGRFRISGAPPGDYFVAVLESLSQGEERLRSVLERAQASAMRVTLVEGEPKSLTLRLSNR